MVLRAGPIIPWVVVAYDDRCEGEVMIKSLRTVATGHCLPEGGPAAVEGSEVNRGADLGNADLQPVVWHTFDPVVAHWLLVELE